MTFDSADSLRQKARSIAERFGYDDSYRERMLADPESVLREEGIYDEVVLANELLAFICIGSCQYTSCADGTCSWTVCPETCVNGVTLYQQPPINVV